MSAPNPVDELAGHFLKIFTVGMLAFMVIAIVTSAGEEPTRQLIYWSLIGLFITCGALLGLLGASQLSGQFAAVESRQADGEKVSAGSELDSSRNDAPIPPTRRPPSLKRNLAVRQPHPPRSGEIDAI